MIVPRPRPKGVPRPHPLESRPHGRSRDPEENPASPVSRYRTSCPERGLTGRPCPAEKAVILGDFPMAIHESPQHSLAHLFLWIRFCAFLDLGPSLIFSAEASVHVPAGKIISPDSTFCICGRYRRGRDRSGLCGVFLGRAWFDPTPRFDPRRSVAIKPPARPQRGGSD